MKRDWPDLLIAFILGFAVGVMFCSTVLALRPMPPETTTEATPEPTSEGEQPEIYGPAQLLNQLPQPGPRGPGCIPDQLPAPTRGSQY